MTWSLLGLTLFVYVGTRRSAQHATNVTKCRTCFISNNLYHKFYKLNNLNHKYHKGNHKIMISSVSHITGLFFSQVLKFF